MIEIKKGSLAGLALDRLNDLLDNATDGVTSECVNNKTNLERGTPLCDISVAITDAKRWVNALLSELN